MRLTDIQTKFLQNMGGSSGRDIRAAFHMPFPTDDIVENMLVANDVGQSS